jgi:hypothetical protein
MAVAFPPSVGKKRFNEKETNMTRQTHAAARRKVCKGMRNLVRAGSPRELRSPIEGLLRDLAVVLHATAKVRRMMEAEQLSCSAVA